jgi:hypothetical protein
MGPLFLAALLASGHAGEAGVEATPARLPAIALRDQEGKTLDLAALRGFLAVIVYGGRAAVERHIAWGQRLAERLLAEGRYRPGDARSDPRVVQILAVAQMGRVPGPFREMLRAFIRPRVEAGHSLWLDWDNALASAFGERDADSTVLVVDRGGGVRLVLAGPPDVERVRAVTEALRRLP